MLTSAGKINDYELFKFISLVSILKPDIDGSNRLVGFSGIDKKSFSAIFDAYHHITIASQYRNSFVSLFGTWHEV